MGTWHWDITNGAMIWDAAQFELYGIPQEAFVPQIETFYRLLHPEDIEGVRRATAAVAALTAANTKTSGSLLSSSSLPGWVPRMNVHPALTTR